MSRYGAGWRSLKAYAGDERSHSTLLRRSADDELRTVKTVEGIAGWKEGLTVTRYYRCKAEAPNGAFYTFNVRDENDSIMAEVVGDGDEAGWARMLDALAQKGYKGAAQELQDFALRVSADTRKARRRSRAARQAWRTRRQQQAHDVR